MPRIKYPSIKDAAAEVLRTVVAEGMIKTAERQLLHDVEHPQSDVTAGLRKLAATLRTVDDEPEVTYEDLHNFVMRCNR
jgi:hypothetical protein